jgi:4-amino-4-deoxy-L-arabinose transferase-like glycosyltransferase
LVNPLLGGIAILLAYALIRRLYNREIADLVVLLLASSPWLVFLSASLMPHPLTLVCSLLGLLGVERARETSSIGWAGVSGASFGVLLHVRPLEAVSVSAAASLWWLVGGWRKLRLAALATALVTGLAMAGLFLAYNKALTGNALLVPINKYFDNVYYPGANRLGFGPDVGNFGWTGLDALPGHGPIDVVMNTNQNLYLLNFELFGWACGSLLFVFLLLGWGRVRDDGLMWALIFAVWAAMSLYWFSGGPDFGARYWYQMILPLAVLTARGARVFAERSREAAASSAAEGWGDRIWAFVALASLLGFVNLLPWRSLDKYHHYRGVRPDIRKLERQYNFGRSLVLIRGPRWPDYASAFTFNPPTFEPDVPGPIFARELGPESIERLRNYYRDRPVWIVAGPSVTGAAAKIVLGPIPPGQPHRPQEHGQR